MGILACIGVISPFPFYYFLWNQPQTWVNLCGKDRDPSKTMAMVSHVFKLIQFVSLYSVSTLSWPPPLYFWPLILFGQFLNFRSLLFTETFFIIVRFDTLELIVTV
ncbi:putative phosphatidyl-N-methylethanolamine N-methyltransferase [Helianthus debilis subsp. tardiflorus]